MTKLIALVDGSIYSHSVCEHAAWIAARTAASVELLHVIGRRETASAPGDLSGNLRLGARTALLEELSKLDEQRGKLAQKRGRAILEDAEAALRQAGKPAGPGEVTTRLRIGDLVEAVAEVEADADLVVIGKRGEAADFARLHLGSNLERVARSSRKPLFVAARAFKPIGRVLIAYDGGTSAMKAVDSVARSPLFAGLDCRLVTVGSESEEARRRLADAASTLKAGGHAVETELLHGHPETAIARKVEEAGIDLLVMGAYGHSRIRSLIIGSTTAEMLRSCRIPVMLYR